MRVVLVLAALFIAAPIVASRLVQSEVYGDFYPDGSKKTMRTMRRTFDGELENHGPFLSYYPDGRIESTGMFAEGMREGEWIWFYEDGKVKARCLYHADEGDFRSFFPSGKPLRRGRMLGLEREGVWTEWFENGNKRMEGLFRQGKQHGLWTYWAESDPSRTRTVLWDQGEQVR